MHSSAAVKTEWSISFFLLDQNDNPWIWNIFPDKPDHVPRLRNPLRRGSAGKKHKKIPVHNIMLSAKKVVLYLHILQVNNQSQNQFSIPLISWIFLLKETTCPENWKLCWIFWCAESACPDFWKSPVRSEEIIWMHAAEPLSWRCYSPGQLLPVFQSYSLISGFKPYTSLIER